MDMPKWWDLHISLAHKEYWSRYEAEWAWGHPGQCCYLRLEDARACSCLGEGPSWHSACRWLIKLTDDQLRCHSRHAHFQLTDLQFCWGLPYFLIKTGSKYFIDREVVTKKELRAAFHSYALTPALSLPRFHSLPPSLSVLSGRSYHLRDISSRLRWLILLILFAALLTNSSFFAFFQKNVLQKSRNLTDLFLTPRGLA